MWREAFFFINLILLNKHFGQQEDYIKYLQAFHYVKFVFVKEPLPITRVSPGAKKSISTFAILYLRTKFNFNRVMTYTICRKLSYLLYRFIATSYYS